ncbi:MAG: hypothetical protein CVT77_01900 [Alphaproteobacteria bacterium HGW-Alphaproteobacteria-16]|nr:MAG: hypothetical protein CVT77_01900 [Alphaproteobacteria bacterium HGW-Alphaproteobacteria-16]
MQKFDWNTFNATHDHDGGPISRYVHDDEAFDTMLPETAPHANSVQIIVSLVCAAIILTGMIAMKMVVS